jgi:ABC-type antimicrobial peptide transport system permease subunit
VGFYDRVTWLAVASGVALAGVLACVLPAWQAARTNPMESLRIG